MKISCVYAEVYLYQYQSATCIYPSIYLSIYQRYCQLYLCAISMCYMYIFIYLSIYILVVLPVMSLCYVCLSIHLYARSTASVASPVSVSSLRSPVAAPRQNVTGNCYILLIGTLDDEYVLYCILSYSILSYPILF